VIGAENSLQNRSSTAFAKPFFFRVSFAGADEKPRTAMTFSAPARLAVHSHLSSEDRLW
jgi:hypothetical protein